MCICILCTFQEHKGHDVQSFSEGLKKHQYSLDTLVTACRDRITCVKDQLDMIRACESGIRKAEDHIRDTTIESISAIRKNEKQMVEELYDTYGEDTLQYLKEKNVLQDILDNLSSSCSLTEIILKDKSIELLLLRREIQDKLEMLLQGHVHPPPVNLTRQVRVKPGYVALGHVVVGETAEENKALKIIGKFCDADAQTEIVMGKENHTPLTGSGNGYDSGTECSAPGDVVKARATKTLETDNYFRDLQTTPTMTDSVKLAITSVQTESLPVAEKGMSTQDVEVWSQWTNTPSINVMERSTLTTMTETNDHQTETVGLVDLVSTISGPELPHVQNTGTLTDFPNLKSKSTNTVAKQQCNKKTSTVRNLMMEKCTLTDKVHKFDFGVMAKVPGSDKGIGTKTIVCADACEGGSDVILKTTDAGTDAIWPGIRRVRHKSTLTMNELLYSTQETETEAQVEFEDRGCSPCPLDDLQQVPSASKRKLPLESEGSKRICTQDETVTEPKLESFSNETQTDISLYADENIYINIGNRPELINAETNTEKGASLQNDKGTSMGSCVKVTDMSSGTVEIRRLERALNPRSLSFDDSRGTPIKMKDKCTSTYVQTAEQATYMIQPVILSTGTNTPIIYTSEKSLETESDTKDSWNLPFKKQTSKMIKCKEGIQDITTYTTTTAAAAINEINSIRVTDVGTDPIDIPRANTATMTTEMRLTNSESSHVLENLQNATTTMLAVEKQDKETNYEPVRTSDTATMTFVLTSDVGVLKRPHAVSRSTSMKKVKTADSETHMDTPQQADKSAMTEKAITAPRTRHAMTATTVVTLSDAGTSTPVKKTVNRESSPFRTRTFERQTSPIRTKAHHKGISTNLKVPSSEKSTATFKIELKNTSTGTPIIKVKDRESSPIRTQSFDKSTSVDKMATSNVGTTTDNVKHVNAMTTTRHFVHTMDKATVPVKFPGKNKAIMAMVSMSTKESETTPTRLSDKCCATIPPSVTETGTGMAHVQYYEKETCTPRINLMHKNVATENISMADKQTATLDVSAAYRDLISPRGCNPVTVSRGTCTTGPGKSNMVDRETSPIKSLPFLVEKATDPIRKVYVNKAVSVTKADLMCPVDKFQRAGQGRPRILPKNMPKEEPEPKFQPSMTTIQELSSDEEGSSPIAHQRILGRIHNHCESPGDDNQNITHREKLWVTASRLGGTTPCTGKYTCSPATKDQCDQSTFSANGSTQTTSILCKVETGTSTPPVETEDKAMCTESLSVDGKITECISKLRTVSKRLEAQTTSLNTGDGSIAGPIYSKADSTRKEAVMTQAMSSPVVSGLLATKEGVHEREGLAPLPNITKRTKREGGSKLGAIDSACPPFLAKRELHSIDTGTAGNGENGNGTGNGNGRSKARKQRLDITQLLHRPPGSTGLAGGITTPGVSSRTPYRPSMLGPRFGILDESARNMDPAHRRLRAKMSAIESPEDECSPPISERISDKDSDSGSSSSSQKQRSERPKLDRMLGPVTQSPTGSPKIIRRAPKVQQQSPMVKRKGSSKERPSKSRSPPKQLERRESASSDNQGVCCGLSGSPKCPHKAAPSPKVPRKKKESTRLLPKRPTSASSSSSTSSTSTEEGCESPVRHADSSKRKSRKSP